MKHIGALHAHRCASVLDPAGVAVLRIAVERLRESAPRRRGGDLFASLQSESVERSLDAPRLRPARA